MELSGVVLRLILFPKLCPKPQHMKHPLGVMKANPLLTRIHLPPLHALWHAVHSSRVHSLWAYICYSTLDQLTTKMRIGILKHGPYDPRWSGRVTFGIIYVVIEKGLDVSRLNAKNSSWIDVFCLPELACSQNWVLSKNVLFCNPF